MAIAFRSTNGSTYGTGTSNPNIVVSKPSGVADGDLLVASFYCDDSTMSTVPTGWTLIKEVENTYASPHFWIRAYWKRASSEGANWTWVTSANVWYAWEVVAYTGGLASGDPLDGTATSWSNPDSAAKYQVLLPAVTTTVDGSMLVAACGNFDGRAWTSGTAPVTNERVDQNGLTHYDGIKTPAGSSGTITIFIASSDANQIAGVLFALKAAADGPSPISGTGSATLAPVTASASGTNTPPSITGTGAATLARASMSASGTVTAASITGTGAATLARASASASGAVTFAGTASATLQAARASGTGALGMSGTGAVSLGPVTAAATASLSFSGSASATLSPVDASAAGSASGQHFVDVGNGYTDVTPRQMARTSDDRLWIASWQFDTYPQGSADGTSQTLRMYRADQAGMPAAFTRMDSVHEPAGVNSWSIACGAADVLHVAWTERTAWNGGTNLGTVSHLHYAQFDTGNGLWGTVEDVDLSLGITNDIGQGDEMVSVAVDADGAPHVVYLKYDGTQRRVNYRNRTGGSWSAATIVDDQAFGANEKCWHPGISFDQGGRTVVAWQRGDFNGNSGGRIFVRVYDGAWGTTADVVGADTFVGIDQGVPVYIDGANRYHITYLSATDKYVCYSYSDTLGASWAANAPGGGTATGDDPAVGPGDAGRVRIYAHGADATPNITYFEGAGGAAAWDARADYIPDTATAYDCSVNVRWSRYYHYSAQRLDVAYWKSTYPTNELYVGSDTASPNGDGNARLSPVSVSASGILTAPGVTGAGSAALQPMQASVAGSLAFSADGAASFQLVQASGAATNTPPAVSGTASVSLQPVQASGSGLAVSGFGGMAVVALTPVQASGAGEVVPPAVTGDIVVALQPVQVSASGAFALPGVSGNGAASLQPVAITGEASVTLSGAASASLSPVSASAAAEMAYAAAAIATLGWVAVAASGNVMQDITGAALVALLPIAASGAGSNSSLSEIGTAALTVSILYSASLSVAALGTASITVEAG